jgi:hypothetical protein
MVTSWDNKTMGTRRPFKGWWVSSMYTLTYQKKKTEEAWASEEAFRGI